MKNGTFVPVIREAIKQRLQELGISQRQCALDCALDYINFNKFLLGKRTLPLVQIEAVLKHLNLKIKPE